ncbi:MAG: hypothetical protein ACI4RC_05255 [Oscillospiraceae bacterium]
MITNSNSLHWHHWHHSLNSFIALVFDFTRYIYPSSSSSSSTEDTVYIDGNTGAVQAARIIQEVQGLFAGGLLDEKDRDGLMRTLQEIYWETKEILNQKKK